MRRPPARARADEACRGMTATNVGGCSKPSLPAIRRQGAEPKWVANSTDIWTLRFGSMSRAMTCSPDESSVAR